MYELRESFIPFFLVGLGAIFGSLLRLYLSTYFGLIISYKYVGTFLVNIIASFSLGFILALLNHSGLDSLQNQSGLFLLICAGFLGSLSTFSTFIIDLLDILLAKRYKFFAYFSILSVVGGLSAGALGLYFGYV